MRRHAEPRRVTVRADPRAAGPVRRRSERRPKVRAGDSEVLLSARELGEPLGERATLVQFSSAFCQPCRATRRTLEEVAAMVDGVAHVELDAEAQLGLVRQLDIRKTPTVLVLDADGRIVRRASGQPRRADVIAALGHAV
ncbi:thioredoxin family protein [Streptomyces sp. NBC_01387]|uniref:thioredoxin family protein n=1 Tax=unclassified Streptomyces TaxID=2593676 RepID=UPI002024D3EA|nr:MULTISPECIES: thioredoxin family protein [unclassified Streptomyces]WSC23938.1 thioredoxin family protein [Streptomyces sp. NBC_01766]